MRTWNSGIHNYRKWDVVRASFADEWHSHSKFWHSQIWHSHSHSHSHSQLFTFTSLAFSLSSYYRAFNWSSISYLQSSAKFRFIVQIHRSHNISIFCKIQLLQTFNACMCNKTRFPSLTFLHYYFCTTH